MKYLLFFLIVPALLINNAYAEAGETFDTRINPDGTVTWTSHYPRINHNDQWVNYFITDGNSLFEFRSANLVFDFNKDNCFFKLYDPEDNTEVIPAYSSELFIDSIQVGCRP